MDYSRMSADQIENIIRTKMDELDARLTEAEKILNVKVRGADERSRMVLDSAHMMAAKAARAERVLRMLKRGTCWCEMGIGHSEACLQAKEIFCER